MRTRTRSNARQLPEHRLCQVVGAHLQAQGWKVVAEVPIWERSVDLGAVKDGQVLLVEAKSSFTKKLAAQVARVSYTCNKAVVLVGTVPRQQNVAWAKLRGIGIWRVTPEGVLDVILEPQSQRAPSWLHVNRISERIRRMAPSLDGGLPCLKGLSPACSVEEATEVYRAAHPKATWADIFANVPNHYASARSMRSAAHSNRRHRAFRDRRRTQRNVQPAGVSERLEGAA